jgi:hypothetical protein
MGKFKPARRKPRPAGPARGAIPCLVLLFSGLALMFLLLYFVLSNANR